MRSTTGPSAPETREIVSGDVPEPVEVDAVVGVGEQGTGGDQFASFEIGMALPAEATVGDGARIGAEARVGEGADPDLGTDVSFGRGLHVSHAGNWGEGTR